MAGSPDVADLIANVPLFGGLDGKSRRAIAREGKELNYKAGEPMVGEKRTGVGFFLILEGKAEVRKGDKVLASLGKGQFFGEMSLIDGLPRSADVVAIDQTRCWALPAWSFAGVIKAHPEMALPMLKELVKRLRAAQTSPAV